MVGYFLLTVLYDVLLSYPVARSKLTCDPVIEDAPYEDDADVAKEAERIEALADSGKPGGEADDAIVLTRLRKVYSQNRKVAVKKLSFAIKKGECFGFLGINGAGKTSTLKVLSGDDIPSAGSGNLMGYDILKEQVKVSVKKKQSRAY